MYIKNQSGIYMILNNVNGKIYIGLSKNLHKRKNDHFNLLKKNKHYNYHLQNAFNKYGQDSFSFLVLQYVENNLNEWEKFWIKYFNSQKNGYNISMGGESVMLGLSHTDEAKKKISKASLGRKLSKESLKKRGLSNSKNTNSSGLYRVSIQKSNRKNKPFLFIYEYRENKKRKKISKTDLCELKREIEKLQLPWIILDEYKYHHTIYTNYLMQKITPNPNLPYITKEKYKDRFRYIIVFHNKRFMSSLSYKKIKNKYDDIINNMK